MRDLLDPLGGRVQRRNDRDLGLLRVSAATTRASCKAATSSAGASFRLFRQFIGDRERRHHRQPLITDLAMGLRNPLMRLSMSCASLVTWSS